MVSGTPPPLSVDPEELSAAGGALHSAASDLPPPPSPFMPVGADPLSAEIIGQIPAIETPIVTKLPLVKTQSTTTAQNVIDAAQMYVAADQRNGAAISQQMQNVPTPGSPGSGGSAPAAGGSAPAAGGADPMSQMMGMPMQMAGQMAQMPMQMMGAVAAVPQGAMQGVQQAGQQVQQMVGQFGQGGTGSQGGGGSEASLPSVPEPPSDQFVEAPASETNDATQDDGATAGNSQEERAPERDDADRESDSATAPPGRHRAAEPSDGINL